MAEKSNESKTRPTNPVDAIKKEVKKAQNAPRKLGRLRLQSANKWIDDAKAQPDPEHYYHGMFVEGEITFVFSAPNSGKSLFLMQVAESIARNQKVVVIDCEQSSKQFQRRYTNDETGSTHYFPKNLYRAEVDSELLDTVDQDQAILDSVNQAAKEGFKVVVIDNISFICVDTEKSQTSIEFMRKLIKLKKKYGLTILVVAHTPKRDPSRPLTQNDLSGSSKLMALIDAAIAIGVSAQDPQLRYAKTVKFRSGEYPCPADHVAVYRLEKVDNYTQLTFLDYGNERDHLREKNGLTEVEDMQEFVNLKAQGMSLKEIAEETGFAKTTIHRKIKKAAEMGIVATVNPTQPSEGESFRSTSETDQMEQVERDRRLPFKDEED